ncbi:MAG: phycobilisome linker polypeptide, partial [Gloeomargarita sp. DG02_3_bins_56]
MIPSSIASTTSYNNRMFVFEVVGLRQSQATDNLNYAIRQSGSLWLQVPYPRMNQEMQRIQRLGGRIVSIRPLDTALPAPTEATPATPAAKTENNVRQTGSSRTKATKTKESVSQSK